MGSPQRTTYGNLAFDATLSANHNVSSDITEFPVEEGANPSDHIRIKAATISLDIIFTPLPLGENDPDNRGEAKRNPGVSYAGYQLQKFHDLQGQALPLVMPWRWEAMANMAIASISTPVNAGMDGFKVTATFKQIRFVSSSSVRFERKVPTKVTQKPTVKPDQGKKTPSPESPQLTSIAKENLNAWGVFSAGDGVVAP